MNKGRIGVVGCGIIGSSWAAIFLAAGWDVLAFDPAVPADGVAHRIDAHFQSGGLAGSHKGRLTVAAALDEFGGGLDHVQESIVEDLDAKRELFARLDAICPRSTVLATSSSALPASKIAGNLAGRSRVIVAHPATPPHAMPAVEVVPAPFTAEEVFRRTWDLLDAVGQVPVHVLREVEGFAMNRMQAALLFAMLEMIADEIVTPEGADALIRESFGMRWSMLGPFEGVHLNAPGGIRDYFTRYRPMFAALCAEGQSIDALLSRENLDRLEDYALRSVAIDKIAQRRVWRDSRLIAMRQWKKDEESGHV